MWPWSYFSLSQVFLSVLDGVGCLLSKPHAVPVKATKVHGLVLIILLWCCMTIYWLWRMLSSTNPVAEGCSEAASSMFCKDLLGVGVCMLWTWLSVVAQYLWCYGTFIYGAESLQKVSTISSEWESIDWALYVSGEAQWWWIWALVTYWLIVLNDFDLILTSFIVVQVVLSCQVLKRR